MLWGLSESLDLYQEYLDANKIKEAANENVHQNGKSQSELESKDSSKNDISHYGQNTELLDNVNADVEFEATFTGELKDEVKEDVCDFGSQQKPNFSLKAHANDTKDIANKVTEGFLGTDANEVIKQTAEAQSDLKNIAEQIQQDMHKEDAAQVELSPPASLNILLFGSCDPRHIIKTMAKLYNHRMGSGDGDASSTPQINFYIFDGCMSIAARNMLLMGIALESPSMMNLKSKVHLFMDIYGNSILRPTSHQYLVGKAKTLQNMVTDFNLLEQLAPLIQLDGLRYSERDMLENAFNFYLPRELHEFDIQSCWKQRVRSEMRARYDFRDGAFDWDLNMVLKDRNASQICSQEYRYWRETGIAFTFPEYEYCKTNKTFVVGLSRIGDRYTHRGYVGDMHTGPFCTFGLKTPDKAMMNSAHGDNDYRATDITERNLLELFHELQTRAPYVHDPRVSHKYGSVKLLMGKTLTNNECDLDDVMNYNLPWLNFDEVKLHFVSLSELEGIQKANSRWENRFDVAFVAQNYFHLLEDSFVECLKRNALLILETKLLTTAQKTTVNEFEQKLKEFAINAKLKNVINYNAINAKNSLLKFKKI